MTNICSLINEYGLGDSLIEEIHQSCKPEFIDQVLKDPKAFIRDFYGVTEAVLEEIYLLNATVLEVKGSSEAADDIDQNLQQSNGGTTNET
jgi:hypothetical protein